MASSTVRVAHSPEQVHGACMGHCLEQTCRRAPNDSWSDEGNFHELETLDLRDVFCASQHGDEANQATLASIVRGTGGRLKRLLIDNGYAGADVAEAIASKGGCLEELSMPCCTGLSDAGLQAIAAACKQLRRLCMGGPSRY